jgi:soluble lytic murein transglycosylase-like protein
MLYPEGDSFPKKPAKVYMNNTNLMFPIRPMAVNQQALRETFFYSMLHKDNKLNIGMKNVQFLVDKTYYFKIEEAIKGKINPDWYYAVEKVEIGSENVIPLVIRFPLLIYISVT